MMSVLDNRHLRGNSKYKQKKILEALPERIISNDNKLPHTINKSNFLKS